MSQHNCCRSKKNFLKSFICLPKILYLYKVVKRYHNSTGGQSWAKLRYFSFQANFENLCNVLHCIEFQCVIASFFISGPCSHWNYSECGLLYVLLRCAIYIYEQRVQTVINVTLAHTTKCNAVNPRSSN